MHPPQQSNYVENSTSNRPSFDAARQGDMSFRTRYTSRDRLWSGFEAKLCDTSGGFTERTLIPTHSLTMHVGAPIRATCRCDGKVQHRLQVPGNIDVIPAGLCAAWQDEGPTTVLAVNIKPSLIQTAAEGMGIDSDRLSIEPQLQLSDPRIQHIGWALKVELESNAPDSRLYAECLGLGLAAQLVRSYSPVPPPRIGSVLSKRRLALVLEYVREHLSEDLSVAELATIVRMSPSHFATLFKGSLGVTAHQYVIRARVDLAIELLTSAKLAPSEVALQAGFADQSHMARCMRRVAGITPSVLTR